MKWILIILGVLVALIAVVVIIGALLPKAHFASRTMKLSAPPERVWQSITDVGAFPGWREVKSVETLPARDGRRVWREVDKRGDAITFEVVEENAPRRLVSPHRRSVAAVRRHVDVRDRARRVRLADHDHGKR